MRMGDCYEAAGRYMRDHGLTEKIVLVHGEVTGQGSLDGVKFGHAWIEEGSNVRELANGKNLVMPRAAYYDLGQITRTKKYDHKQFVKKVVGTGHWGPWDFQTAL